MNRQFVSSSNLRSVGYDAATGTLEVEFNNGSVYEYSAVPSSVYDELMAAGSHGTYFAHNIRNRYAYSKIR